MLRYPVCGLSGLIFGHILNHAEYILFALSIHRFMWETAQGLQDEFSGMILEILQKIAEPVHFSFRSNSLVICLHEELLAFL